MTTIDLALTGARAKAKVSGPLTDGAVGIPVRITADEAWAELIPTLVARAGNTARQMVIDGEWNSVVPWECLTEGERLDIGVVGIDILEGNVRVPTTWADCGRVLPSPAGAEIGQSRPEPTPDVVDQLEALAQSADRKGSRAVELAEDVQRRADEGEFKGEPGTDADVTAENIREALGYMPYRKQDSGIPESDLNEETQRKLNTVRPVDGIVEFTDNPSENNQLYFPVTREAFDLELPEPGELENIAAELAKKYSKPPSGIPAEDLEESAIPKKLPTPQKITFTGAVSAEWDGSEALTLNIPNPESGKPGMSAYELAVQQGYRGTLEEWIGSLRGAPGEDYILKSKDINDIADLVILKLPNGNGVRY